MANAIATIPTKTARKTLRDELTESTDILQYETERANVLAVGASRVLSQIEARTIGPLEPVSLRLTPTERRMLKAGGIEFDNDFALCRLLEKVRANRESLEEFSFKKLEACKVANADAKKAVDTTQADMSDLDINEETAEPALVRQLAKLQSKLDDLRNTEIRTESELRRQQSLLQQLESAAPQCLKDLFELRKLEAEQDPKFELFKKAEDDVRRIEQLLECTKPDGPFDVSRSNARIVLLPYAREYCPEVITKTKDTHREICDQNAIARHFAELREQLPTLKAERDQLKADCEKIMADAQPMGPIHDWIDSKGRLVMDMFR